MLTASPAATLAGAIGKETVRARTIQLFLLSGSRRQDLPKGNLNHTHRGPDYRGNGRPWFENVTLPTRISCFTRGGWGALACSLLLAGSQVKSLPFVEAPLPGHAQRAAQCRSCPHSSAAVATTRLVCLQVQTSTDTGLIFPGKGKPPRVSSGS